MRNFVIASDVLHKSLHSWDMINAEKFNFGAVLKQKKSVNFILLFGFLLMKYE